MTDLLQQFKVILKWNKIRAGIMRVQQDKNNAVRKQDFKAAAKLRDKEKLLYERLEEVDKQMVEIYDEHFPEESKEIDGILNAE